MFYKKKSQQGAHLASESEERTSRYPTCRKATGLLYGSSTLHPTLLPVKPHQTTVHRYGFERDRQSHVGSTGLHHAHCPP